MSETMTPTTHKAAALTAVSALALYDAAESTADKVRAAAAMAEVLRAKLPKPKPPKAAPDLLTVENLVVTMKRLSMIVERRSTIPILSHVLLEAKDGMLRLSATDLDMIYTETMRAPGCPDFVATASAHDLAGALRGAKGDVAFRAEVIPGEKPEHYLHVSAGGLDVRLPGLAPKDFPVLRTPHHHDGTAYIPSTATLEIERLLEPLQFVRTAVSAEETRYYLNGTYMHVIYRDGTPRLTFAATDGSRLLVDMGEDGAGFDNLMPGVILPRKAIDWMLRNIRDDEAQVDVWAQQVRVTTVTGCFQFKVIDGNYPDYQRVIPADRGRTVLGLPNGKEAAETLDRVLSQTKEKSAAITIDLLSPETAEVRLRSAEGGTATIRLADVHVIGPRHDVDFNGRILREMIALAGVSEMSLSFYGDSADPVRLDWPQWSGRLGVVMPLRR